MGCWKRISCKFQEADTLIRNSIHIQQQRLAIGILDVCIRCEKGSFSIFVTLHWMGAQWSNTVILIWKTRNNQISEWSSMIDHTTHKLKKMQHAFVLVQKSTNTNFPSIKNHIYSTHFYMMSKLVQFTPLVFKPCALKH